MSFDFGPMQNLSNVQASHKSTPGGGGNTGYFKRGQKEEEDVDLGFAKDYSEKYSEIQKRKTGKIRPARNASYVHVLS